MEKEKIFCCLFIGDKKILGQLLLAKDKSLASLTSRHPIPYEEKPHTILGESIDHKKITLIDCVGNQPALVGDSRSMQYKRDIFPHYTAIGSVHILPEASSITSVTFEAEDIGLIFGHRDDIGMFVPNPEDLASLIKKSKHGQIVELGEHPVAFYQAGRSPSFEQELSFGSLTIDALWSYKANDRTGIELPIKNVATIKFTNPLTFDEMMAKLSSISDFISVVSGRFQEVRDIAITTTDIPTDSLDRVDLHWSLAPTLGTGFVSTERDAPVTASSAPQELPNVLKNWLERHHEWLPARLRILNWQKQGRIYEDNRLVAAANAFDILPKDVYPEIAKPSQELLEAKSACKRILNSLPASEEKEGALNTLAYWGGMTLKKKIISRASIVQRALAEPLKDLEAILKTACDVRNYYVHGTDRIGIHHFETLQPLLTDALEFTFIASDLIECGWDINRWINRGISISHPLSFFYRTYEEDLKNYNLAQAAAKSEKEQRKKESDD
ncbi:HEPN domain-containing protein [Pseudomonas sp. F3-2]|uniref:ApeA N-terminal domain 1-containing protein n=1 Tax=Pseudomonas sp. F3-2 TaxID=3141539 RepID=UPI00315CF009